MRLTADVDLYLSSRALILNHPGRTVVRFPATPTAWSAVTALSGALGVEVPGGARDAAVYTQASISTMLFEAGMLESALVPSQYTLPAITTDGGAVSRWKPARVTQLAVHVQSASESPPWTVFVMDSWADLALLDPSRVPSGQVWAVCRFRAGTVQISSPFGLPETAICWGCLPGRLLGHDDLVQAIWPLLRDGTCTRMTASSDLAEGAELLVASAMSAVAAEPGAVVLERGPDEEPVTLHHVQPYASCRHAPADQPAKRRPRAGLSDQRQLPAPLVRAEARLRPLEGSVTGLIEAPTVISNDDLPIRVAMARYADPSGQGTILEVGTGGSITSKPELSRNAFGGGLSPVEAAVRAALEALERYCSIQQLHDCSLPRRQAVPGRRHLCPERGIVVTAKEDPRCCEEPTWVSCTALDGATVVAIPASFCYHRRLRPAVSGCTGMALGETRADAVITGYLEYLEREGVNAWWRQARPAFRVPLDCVEDELTRVTAAFHRRRGRELFALRIPPPIPGVEVVVAVSSLTELGFPVLGMGAGFTLTQATAKAVREAGQVLAFEGAERQKWQATPTSAIRWLAAHANVPFLSSSAWANPTEPADKLARAVELSQAVGRLLLILDYQRPEVPLPCVRVFVPAEDRRPPQSVLGPGWGDLPW
jgi:ribosomal protein S12 methylthiotransferase accessory factor YcaO